MTDKNVDRHSADSSQSMTLADKKQELRKFVSLSDIQLQALINRISPDDNTRKVMQEDLAKQSKTMKSQIETVSSIQEADKLYEQFAKQFK
ncbi:hypothetical protein [Nicoliella lavandulae]|uniref:Uncharacterized protein n=1 Tax=Nicoliella lavandulae TaxID=3082954 RepID=A0ABU8SIR9_9LACO